MSRWLTEEMNPWRQTWGPDKGHYSLDEIIYWTHQMWLQGLIKVQKKGKYRIIGGGTPPSALQQTEAPLQGEASLLTTTSTSTVFIQMSISRAFLCPECFLSHLFLWKKDPKNQGTYILNVTENRKKKKRFWAILLDCTVPTLWRPMQSEQHCVLLVI